MINIRDGLVISSFDLDLVSRDYNSKIMGAKNFIVNTKLEDDVLYDVALDQSNTCTGMTIRPVKEDKVLICELINNGIDFSHYRQGLITVLKKLLVGHKVRYFIMEEPLGYITGRRNKELTRLKHVLTDFVNDTEGLDIKKFDAIAPQSWRAGLIKKDNPHPKNSKLACVHEITSAFPETKNLYSYEKPAGADYDGFESFGILLGYISRHAITNDSDVTKIIGKKNTTQVALAIFIKPGNQQDLIANVVSMIWTLSKDIKDPVIKIYDDDSTLYENVKMSLTDIVTLTVVTNELANVSIRHLFKYKNGEGNFYMIVIPASIIEKAFILALANLGIEWEIFY